MKQINLIWSHEPSFPTKPNFSSLLKRSTIEMQVNSFSCAHMGHQGRLMVSPVDIYFVSTPYRLDLIWNQIAEIGIETRRVQGKSTTVIVVVSERIPHIFSNFRDVNSAEQQLQKYLELSRSHQELPIPSSSNAVADQEVRAASLMPTAQPVPSEFPEPSPKPAPMKLVGVCLLASLTLTVVLSHLWWSQSTIDTAERRLSRLHIIDFNGEASSGLDFLSIGTSLLSALCLIFVGFH